MNIKNQSLSIVLVFSAFLCPAQEKSSLFEFHSGFWINLHHFIYYQALLKKPGNGSRKLNYKDTIALNSLNDTTKRQWAAAIDYYAKNITHRDLLFDTGLVKVKNILENKENEPALTGPGLPAELETVLNNVAQSYRTLFWEKQNYNNQLWINAVKPLVLSYGDALTKELARIYLTHWPEEAIRVDITNYASWSGAYTSLDPDRVTISSADSGNQQIAALEIIFHETSHVLIDSIRNKIHEICRNDHRLLPDRALWHAILFYSTGEVVRKHFKQYIPYAYKNGLWNRAWPMYIGCLEKDWQPYIDGNISFDMAIGRLVRHLEVPE